MTASTVFNTLVHVPVDIPDLKPNWNSSPSASVIGLISFRTTDSNNLYMELEMANALYSYRRQINLLFYILEEALDCNDLL